MECRYAKSNPYHLFIRNLKLLNYSLKMRLLFLLGFLKFSIVGAMAYNYGIPAVIASIPSYLAGYPHCVYTP